MFSWKTAVLNLEKMNCDEESKIKVWLVFFIRGIYPFQMFYVLGRKLLRLQKKKKKEKDLSVCL